MEISNDEYKQLVGDAAKTKELKKQLKQYKTAFYIIIAAWLFTLILGLAGMSYMEKQYDTLKANSIHF